MYFVRISKDKRGHLVEWIEKLSFSRLNKLFKIDQSRRNHSVLLIKKNLRVFLAQAKTFVISLLPRLAPSTLVSGEHFMLKDLSFYEVARFADTKAIQARLDTQKKKSQERTLCQAPGSTS